MRALKGVVSSVLLVAAVMLIEQAGASSIRSKVSPENLEPAREYRHTHDPLDTKRLLTSKKSNREVLTNEEEELFDASQANQASRSKKGAMSKGKKGGPRKEKKSKKESKDSRSRLQRDSEDNAAPSLTSKPTHRPRQSSTRPPTSPKPSHGPRQSPTSPTSRPTRRPSHPTSNPDGGSARTTAPTCIECDDLGLRSLRSDETVVQLRGTTDERKG